MSVKVKQTNKGWLKDLTKRYKKGLGEVAIGFPKGSEQTGLRYPGEGGAPGPRVVDVAVWNNFGVPGLIPRRDFMTPGGQRAAEKTKPIAQEAVKLINRGKSNIDQALNQMGAVGASEVSQAIVELSDPPNAPSTIDEKGSSNPLVDTGLMSGSVTWEVR